MAGDVASDGNPLLVGGSFSVAAMVVLAGLRIARVAALMAGIIVLGWLAVQLSIIGYVSWMQPTAAIAGVIVVRCEGGNDRECRLADGGGA